MSDNSKNIMKAPLMMLLSLLLGAGGLGGHFLNFDTLKSQPDKSVQLIDHKVIEHEVTEHEESRTEFLRRINENYNHCTHNLVHQHDATLAEADLACSVKKLNKLIERQVK